MKIEIPADIKQQEVWEMEKRIKAIEGVEVDLQESKDIMTTAVFVLHLTISVMEQVTAIEGGIEAIHKVAKIIHEFLHRSDSAKASSESMKKVIFVKKGKKIELYNLSIEEIEKIIKDM